jgi:hypothetical protein
MLRNTILLFAPLYCLLSAYFSYTAEIASRNNSLLFLVVPASGATSGSKGSTNFRQDISYLRLNLVASVV